MILHTVNQSPLQTQTLQSCLRFIKPGSSLLLIENGVYGALANTPCSADIEIAMNSISVYALEPDLQARGITHKLLPGIKLADYNTFVDLAAEHSSVQSWL